MRFLLLLFIAFAARLFATPVDPVNFAETLYVTSNASIGSPTGLAWAPDGSGRLFVTRKGNTETAVPADVRVVRNGSVLSTPFATMSPLYAPTLSECGLIGLCFDPDFLNNCYVYFFVTVSSTEQQIIRYTDTFVDNAPVGDGIGAEDYWIGANRTVIVAGLPTRGLNHNGGAIEIGPDGKLYWAIGDTGNNTGADGDLTLLAAKIGRANRFTGSVLNDNPFFDGAGTNNDYIWARGLRNPFTMTFQPGTGKLWLNVVGSTMGGSNGVMPGYEQVFVVERGSHAGWNDYENSQPAGYLTPAIAYRTNSTTTVNLTAGGAERVSGVVTFTTTSPHPFRKGAKVSIAGVGAGSFNGEFYVSEVVSTTQFRVLQSGADLASGGGTATTFPYGGSITGGCFYNSTAFPAAYHGNFFFGDLNVFSYGGNTSSRIARATLNGANEVTSVDYFVQNVNQQLDLCTGPDGALYYTSHASPAVIRRLATTSTAQNVIVQPTAFNVVEGGSALFTVRLAQLPGADVAVSIAKLSGDADLNVAGSTTLTFTNANWTQLQTVTIAAAEDSDCDNDSAVFRVSSSGLPSYDVAVNGIDNDDPRLVISMANLTVGEGASTNFSVSLASAPPANVTVAVAQQAGDSDINVSGGTSLLFTPGNFATPQLVTIAAGEDADTTPDAAVISITYPGEPARTVNVSAADNELVAPSMADAASLTATVNVPFTYDVDATGNPAPTYFFLQPPAPPSGMTINNATGLVSWTPTATGTYSFNVRAQNSAGTDTQTVTVQVQADAAPVAALTSPQAGAILSGATAEFFGDGVDDAGTIKAEFIVDGIVHFTDVNSAGHYHFGGAHTLFDTTVFTNGPHVVRMRVTDTVGQTGFAEAQVFISNGAAAWKSEKFTPAEQANAAISGDLADPDGDGVKNIFEYLTDSPPKAGDLSRVPQATVVSVSGVDYLALQFVTARWADDVSVSVEAAPSPAGPWTSIYPSNPALWVNLIADTPAPGLDTCIVRDSQSLTSGSRYLRLRAVR